MIQKLKEQLNCNETEYGEMNFKLYGVFNSNAYKRLWTGLEDFWNFSCSSLFEGKMAEELEAVSPYLVELPLENEFIDEILDAYGKNACIFFCSPLSFEETLEKMRSVFNVEDEEGNKGWLRFYSPDIFRGILEEDKSKATLRALFSQIMYYYCEAEDDPFTLKRYRYDAKTLSVDEISLIS